MNSVVFHHGLAWAGNFPSEQFYPTQYIRGIGAVSRRVRVIVQDRRGDPGEGIEVSVLVPETLRVLSSGRTDSDGVFELEIPNGVGRVVAVASLPEGPAAAAVDILGTNAAQISFRSVRRIGRFINEYELAAGIGGIALTAAGVIIKNSLGTFIGGVGAALLAAAVFSVVMQGR